MRSLTFVCISSIRVRLFCSTHIAAGRLPSATSPSPSLSHLGTSNGIYYVRFIRACVRVCVCLCPPNGPATLWEGCRGAWRSGGAGIEGEKIGHKLTSSSHQEIGKHLTFRRRFLIVWISTNEWAANFVLFCVFFFFCLTTSPFAIFPLSSFPSQFRVTYYTTFSPTFRGRQKFLYSWAKFTWSKLCRENAATFRRPAHLRCLPIKVVE